MTRGGKRDGAGRPVGTGKYGEATKSVRVPVGQVGEVELFLMHKSYCLPLYASSVSAGQPSPADEQIASQLDVYHHLVKNPDATFLVRASGESMRDAGISDGDMMVVDRSVDARSGKIVVAAVDGHLTVKRLLKTEDKTFLMPENDAFTPIELHEGNDMFIWGVVTTVLHEV